MLIDDVLFYSSFNMIFFAIYNSARKDTLFSRCARKIAFWGDFCLGDCTMCLLFKDWLGKEIVTNRILKNNVNTILVYVKKKVYFCTKFKSTQLITHFP